tara:strand:- start:6248 stop:7969 length:1722 start_codon:yes stop_codon:yes gene_type:complete
MKRKKIIKLYKIHPFRLELVFLLLSTGLFILLGKIAWLQIIRGDELQLKARSFQVYKTTPLKLRRSIVDRNNRLLAFDESSYILWAHPRFFNFPGDLPGSKRRPEEVAKQISKILNIPLPILVEKLSIQETGIKLSDDLNLEQANKIRNLFISGLDIEEYSKRVYPQGELFASVIGFVNKDKEPQSGLELKLNQYLKINKKVQIYRKGADGTPLPDNTKPGNLINDDTKLRLTLDSRLQLVAHKAIEEQVKEWNAKKGFALVMNVKDGEILALASAPSYNPNKYWKYNSELYKNWYVQDLIEPGSTFKPINLALALQAEVIDENGVVNDEGVVNIGGWSLSNWNKKGNGIIDYPRVLQVSSNVGMVKIMSNLPADLYWDLLNKLEIGESLETDLGDSLPGQMKSKTVFVNQPIEPAVTSFGQGFAIPPIKLAQLYAALANGGKLVQPHISFAFKEYIDQRDIERKELLFSPQVSSTILSWMESVVENGSGNGTRIKGYNIGGKTGTAQKAVGGTYTSKVCSFIATFPTDNPLYIVMVVVDEPTKSYAYGSNVAVPAAKKIIESLIVLEKIPPK